MQTINEIHIVDQRLFNIDNQSVSYGDTYNTDFYPTIRENLMHPICHVNFNVNEIHGDKLTIDNLKKNRAMFEQAKKQTYYRYSIDKTVMFVIASDELAEIFKGTNLQDKYLDYLNALAINNWCLYGLTVYKLPIHIGKTIEKMYTEYLQAKLSAKSKTD